MGVKGHKDGTANKSLGKTLKKLTMGGKTPQIKPTTLNAAKAMASGKKGGLAGGAMPTLEDVLAEVDSLYTQLMQKDEDLKLAGQIGDDFARNVLMLSALLDRHRPARAERGSER